MVAVNFCVMMVAPWVSDLLLVVVGCWRGVWVAGMGCGVWVCGSSTWGVVADIERLLRWPTNRSSWGV